MQSMDEADYGKEYVIKLTAGHEEFKILGHIASYEQSKSLTAQIHPRYPYLKWDMTDDKTVDVVIMEKLQIQFLHDLTFATELDMNLFMAQCWKDIQSVMDVLWEYKGGHYVHDDVWWGQLLVSAKDGVDRCHAIDFGMIHSMDNILYLEQRGALRAV